MAKRTRLRIQAAEIRFLQRVAGFSLREKGEEFGDPEGVEPRLLGVEMSQLKWFKHLIRMPPFRVVPGTSIWGRPRTHWWDYISSLARER